MAETPPALITPAGLKTALWGLTMHMNMGRVHITEKECVDFPGLRLSSKWDKRARTTTRAFFVDGDEREFDSAAAAAKAWNERRRAAAQPLPQPAHEVAA